MASAPWRASHRDVLAVTGRRFYSIRKVNWRNQVGVVAEVIQVGQPAPSCDFENGASAVGPAILGDPVEVPSVP